MFAWTLIMSYRVASKAMLDTKQFYIDHPVNDKTPNWNAYRLSKSRMMSIHTQSSHWRATCSYNTDGVVLTDYIRSSFVNVDPLTINGAECRKMEYVNIRGSSCTECTIRVVQKTGYTFFFSSWYGEFGPVEKCSFVNAAGAVNTESNFGYYGNINSAHRCSSNSNSTTQCWFGGRPQ